MAVADASMEEPPKKRSKLPLLIGLVLAILLGAGGFYATYSGLLMGSGHGEAEAHEVTPLQGIGFVPLETMIISLAPDSTNSHLRFTAQLEVDTALMADVTLLIPRILDVLNSYLRAVDTASIEDPAAMAKLRAQMLRRIQIVAGEGHVRDLLITNSC